MSDFAERLQAVRTRQQETIRRRAQAEAKVDQVNANRESILAKLKELGFSTPAEAKTRALELKSETESILADIEAKVRSL